jgi:hypothetical protein
MGYFFSVSKTVALPRNLLYFSIFSLFVMNYEYFFNFGVDRTRGCHNVSFHGTTRRDLDRPHDSSNHEV